METYIDAIVAWFVICHSEEGKEFGSEFTSRDWQAVGLKQIYINRFVNFVLFIQNDIFAAFILCFVCLRIENNLISVTNKI